ncbi:Outer membrane protein beta-barrel domain-containing protein [Pseudarcicella hirudinis]|uniref:Outer membrane protein beta-barrel domain-containing protein n=1 Tax=Pseudarcicella hirudinis TaxID=1079859 RepID=A0A1I5RQH5_9BACT|nr:porin family protein [Pseudarcicella hirudinis]SFP60765.1 Outer membrane protein beta-barrel domain-containing protein [Pseudarcicella hirudinis]
MKKVILTLALMSFVFFKVNAQSFFSFGIKGGVNLAKLKTGNFLAVRLDGNGKPVEYNGTTLKDNIQESLDSRTGYVGGVYARFGRKFFIQPELLFSAKGGSLNILKGGQNAGSETIQIEYTNFDVPLLLGYRIGLLHLNAGPVASFNVSSNQKLSDALDNYTKDGVVNAFKKASYGYQVGGGLDIGSFTLDVRYEGTFSDVASADIQSSNASFSQKSNLWQLTLGIKLF